MNGKSFNNFDEFRKAFWKEVANSSYANEFSKSNITRMSNGYAPKVAKSQQYGELGSYVIHHKVPIHAVEMFTTWIIWLLLRQECIKKY